MARTYELEQEYTQQQWAEIQESIELSNRFSNLIGATNDDELKRYAGDSKLYCRWIQGAVFASECEPDGQGAG